MLRFIARGLEDYTKGEFLKVNLLKRRKLQQSKSDFKEARKQGDQDFEVGIKQYTIYFWVFVSERPPVSTWQATLTSDKQD